MTELKGLKIATAAPREEIKRLARAHGYEMTGISFKPIEVRGGELVCASKNLLFLKLEDSGAVCPPGSVAPKTQLYVRNELDIKPDWSLHLEARRAAEPASGIHLLAALVTNFAREKAAECGYELTIEQSFDE